jgi:hypothetical protein
MPCFLNQLVDFGNSLYVRIRISCNDLVLVILISAIFSKHLTIVNLFDLLLSFGSFGTVLRVFLSAYLYWIATRMYMGTNDT